VLWHCWLNGRTVIRPIKKLGFHKSSGWRHHLCQQNPEWFHILKLALVNLGFLEFWPLNECFCCYRYLLFIHCVALFVWWLATSSFLAVESRVISCNTAVLLDSDSSRWPSWWTASVLSSVIVINAVHWVAPACQKGFDLRWFMDPTDTCNFREC